MALGCLKELQPIWVREGDDQVETLSINIFVQKMKIRCCVAYGCQESEYIDKKEAFWNYLDEEVEEATTTGAGLVIQFDGNLWAAVKSFQMTPDPKIETENFLSNF